MIRLLLIIVMVVLFLVAYYLRKNSPIFAKVLANEKDSQPIEFIFNQFAKACWLFVLIGIFPLISGQKMIALLYIALIMLTSTVFSLRLAKLLS